MKSLIRAVLPSVFALALAACGSREFRVQQQPSVPLGSFGKLLVQPFAIEDPPDPVVREKALKMADLITREVRERLAPKFEKEGSVLTVQGRLVGFDPGSQAARYWAGFGAGEGTIVVEVTFLDEAGGTVAKGAAWGSVSGGWFGGSLNSAGKRAAKAVVDFVQERY